MKIGYDEWLTQNGFGGRPLTAGQERLLKASYLSDMGQLDRDGAATDGTDLAAAADPPEQIRFTADVDIEAAAENGHKRPSFSINAYHGGPLPLNGYSHPVSVDLAGAVSHSNNVPVLLNHDDEKIVGQGRPSINGQGITISGVVTGDDGAAAHVVSHAKNGFKWQASIGGSVRHMEFVPRGHTEKVNGRPVNGPANIARGFILKEVSFVPVGADPDTSADIAAKGKHMSDENTVVTAQASILAERKRISEIRGIAKGHDDILARAIDEGWDAERTELHVLRSESSKTELDVLRASRSGRPPAIPTRNDVDHQRGLVAAMLMSSGLPEAVVGKYHTELEMNIATSRALRGAGIQTAFRSVLRAVGKFDDMLGHQFGNDEIRASYEASGMLQAAGISTMSLPGILGDFLHKRLLGSYDAVEVTWPTFCAVRQLDDFQPQHIFRMVGAGEFQQVGAGGELQHISLDEQAYSLQASTYGALIVLARQLIINDDLSAFGQIAGIMGRLGAIKLESTIYTLLLSNPAGFFSTDNNNYLSGGSSALSLASLGSGEKQFLLQIDENGFPILVSPQTLLVGPTNAAAARQLIGSTDLLQTALQSAPGAGVANQQPSGNPFVRQLTPAVSPWIENEGIPGNSSTKWFLAANPTVVAPVFAGFLNGIKSPTVQSGEASFETLGMQFRAFFDFGVAMADYRGMLMSVGA